MNSKEITLYKRHFAKLSPRILWGLLEHYKWEMTLPNQTWDEVDRIKSICMLIKGVIRNKK